MKLGTSGGNTMLKVLKDMLKMSSPNIFTIWYFALMFVQNMFEHVLIVSKSRQPPQNLASFEVAFFGKIHIWRSGLGPTCCLRLHWIVCNKHLVCERTPLRGDKILEASKHLWHHRPGQAPHNVKSEKELQNNNINSQQPTWTQTSLNYWKESTRRFQKRNALD